MHAPLCFPGPLTTSYILADHAFYNIHKELHNPFGGRTLDIAHERFMAGLHRCAGLTRCSPHTMCRR